MTDTYLARTTRVVANTRLTPGEKVALYRMQAILKTDSEADTIRQILRQRLAAEKLIG